MRAARGAHYLSTLFVCGVTASGGGEDVLAPQLTAPVLIMPHLGGHLGFFLDAFALSGLILFAHTLLVVG